VEQPWGEITFAAGPGREALVEMIREHEVDLLIAGPVTRLGMDEAGTLQQVRDFTRLLDAVRAESGRRFATVLVHHESKSGAVSGAWEGAGDTLIHVEARGAGQTRLYVQKARWSSTHHGSTLNLAWTPGEGFEVSDARDYLAEIVALLADGNLRTSSEISAPKGKGGIGASRETVDEHLKLRPDVFIERNGKDVGRSPRATFYELARAPEQVVQVAPAEGTAETYLHTCLPHRGAGECKSSHDSGAEPAREPEQVDGDGDGHEDWSAERGEALIAKHEQAGAGV
jgi:hypothetical protein